MAKLSADALRALIIFTMVENAQVRASVGPVIQFPRLDVDLLGVEFDQALEEINSGRAESKAAPLEVSADFKQAVIDSLLRRMEQQGRVVFG